MRTSLLYLSILAFIGAACPDPGPADNSSTLQYIHRSSASAYLNMPPNERGPIPRLLSQTGAFVDVRTLKPNPALVGYDLNVPFWADGADKRRWIFLPEPFAIHFAAQGEWTFPAGTVFVKHFERNGRRLETRLLVCAAGGGVYGMSYRWRDDQSDAVAVKTSATETIREDRPGKGGPQPWYFPGPDDCRKCHLAVAGGVLGVNTRQLNRAGSDKENQLAAWSRIGLLDRKICAEETATFSKLPGLEQPDTTPEQRARAYLDANCGYCHRPGGAAADFDARYETPLKHQALIDAPARINLGIDRARQIASNDPWRSIVLARLTTVEQTRMPPLGPVQIDLQGAAILRQWIGSLAALPVVAPPTIEPRGADFKGRIRVTLTHAERGAEIRYTLDGSPPGPSSMLYREPLQLAHSATVRARAFKLGHVRSIVVQETYIVAN